MRISIAILALLATSCANYKFWGAEEILRGSGDESVQIRTWVEDLEVEEVVGRMAEGRLTAQFSLLSTRDAPIRVQLSWVWKDTDGFILRSAQGGSGQQDLLLSPGAAKAFSFVSPSPSAIKFFGSIIPLDAQL